MKQIASSLMILLFVFAGESSAQEEGRLFMEVELTITLSGTVLGSGIGALVWLTDPGGPTSIRDTVRDGAVVGTFLGAAAGFFILSNAFIPFQPPQFQEPNIGQNDDASPIMSAEGRIPPQYEKPILAFTLINFNF